MANPAVEKLQAFGIQHGEKAGVAVVSALCLVMFYVAMSRPSFDISADQITKATSQAQQNLNREQPADKIKEVIHKAGIVQVGFEKVVDNRKPGSLDAGRFALTNLLSSPEPGAGLLREQPDLITVAQLQAHPGRGAIRLYDVDPVTGDVVMEPAKKDEPKAAAKKKRRNNQRTMGGMMGGMGTMGGRSQTKKRGESEQKKEQDEAKRRKAEQDRLLKGVAGDVNNIQTQQGKGDAAVAPGDDLVEKEVLKGFRWVVLTGVLDHRRLRDNLARALKIDPASANPPYLRVDLSRRQRNDDGSWTNWKLVDRKYSVQDVLELMTEREPETNPEKIPLIDDKVRLKELVDELPFLEAGYWSGVYHADLINPEALKMPETKKGQTGKTGFGGRGNMGPGGMSPGGAGMAGGGPSRGLGAGGRPGGVGGLAGGGMGPSSGDEGAGKFGSFFGGGGATGIDAEVSKTDADKILVRALDFTVKPDTTYQYRVRIVLKNPNYGNENVLPGVDKDSKELAGPWSEETSMVSVPPDVETYVRGIPPVNILNKRPDMIEFAVVRWNETDGYTIVKNSVPEAVGEVIGEPMSAAIPFEDKDKTRLRSVSIDFTSNRLLVDSAGGPVPVDRFELGVPAFHIPASALILRADGRIEYRDEAGEQVRGELAEMNSIYDQTKKDAEAEDGKKTSNPFGGTGGMGGMGGPTGSG